MTKLVKTTGTPYSAAWYASPCNVLFEIAKTLSGEDFILELGGANFPLLQTPEAVRDVLRDRQADFTKYLGNYTELFGTSRLTSDDPIWRPLRDLSQPYITRTRPEDIATTAHRYFNAAADEILSQTGGAVTVDGPVDFAAAATVCKLVLGFPIEEAGTGIIDDMRAVLRLASRSNFPSAGPPTIEETMIELDAEDARERLRKWFGDIAGRAAGTGEDGLARALAEADLEALDTFGEMATLLFAGFDTTASAITWAMFLLSTQRDTQERLAAQVRGFSQADRLEASDIDKLTEINAFVMEALRIFPPIPVISRQAGAETKAGDLNIHKDDRVLISIIGLHQNPAIWHDPMTPRPARFPGGKLAPERTSAFLPFGDGRRVCPGARFASVEAAVAIAIFLDRMQIEPASNDVLNLRWDVSMRQADGARLMIRSRPE